MNMSKVVLVQPPIEDFYLTKKRTIPYGLASIAAGLLQKKFDVDIIDALATNKSKVIAYPKGFSYLEAFYGKKDISSFSLFHEFKHFGYSFEHIAAQIREKQPFVVGISALFTAYFDSALKTADAIKKFWPHCHIVMGGHHPTVFPEKVLSCDSVDFVVQGEGETSMAVLCQALKNGSEVKKVPGIAFQQNNGTHFISEPFWEKDFNRLPLPETNLISHDFYQRKGAASAMVVSSRGCPMHCSYCSVSASSSYAHFRQRNVDHVLMEIQALIKKGPVSFIDFEDENLCLNKPWFMELFTRIKNLLVDRDVELRAMNGLFPPAIDEDIVCLMKDAGFKTLNLSLGSTSKDQLKKFKRPDVRKAFENALDLARKYKLECVSYIIAAGPGQNAQISLDDLIYLAQKRTLVGLSIFYPAPGSLDYKMCKKQRLLPENFSLMRSTALPIDNTTSRLQAVTLLRLSRILNFLKQIKDTQKGIPAPLPCPKSLRGKSRDRMAVSQKLFQYFLHDGKIRGIDPDGTIFIHKSDKTLAETFAASIQTIEIAGIK